MVDAEIAKITWTHALKIWLAWLWCIGMGSVLTAACLGAVFSILRAEVFNAVMPVVTAIVMFVWWIVGLRMALRKRYGDFHLVLVNDKGGEPSTSPVAPPAPSFTNKHLDALDRLAKLRDTGALTDAEFEAAKKTILNELSG
jgi:hypothetical protein